MIGLNAQSGLQRQKINGPTLMSRAMRAPTSAASAADGPDDAPRPVTAARLADEARAELLSAASVHDARRVRAALRAGTPVDVARAGGWTALMEAAYGGSDHVVPVALLEAGADPLAVSEDGRRAGDIAAERGHAALARLLRCAADAHSARRRGASDMLAAGASRARAAEWWLRDCARGGDLGAMRTFFAAPVADASVSAADPAGVSALALAANSGHRRVIRLLLSHGADINAVDICGMTPLMYASRRGHIDIVHILLPETADPVAMTKVSAHWGLLLLLLRLLLQRRESLRLLLLLLLLLLMLLMLLRNHTGRENCARFGTRSRPQRRRGSAGGLLR